MLLISLYQLTTVLLLLALLSANASVPKLTEFFPNPNRSAWNAALRAITDPRSPNNTDNVWSVLCDSCSLFLHVHYVKAYIAQLSADRLVDETYHVTLGTSGSVGISIERIAIVIYPFCNASVAQWALSPNTSVFNSMSICVIAPQNFPARQSLIDHLTHTLRKFSTALFSYNGSAVGS